MKKSFIKFLIGTALVTALLSSEETPGKEKNWSIGASANTAYNYLWRGFRLHDSMCIQPGAEISIDDLSIGWWGSIGTGGDIAPGFHESDIYAGYSVPMPFFEKLSISSGFTFYLFPLNVKSGNNGYRGLDYSVEGYLGSGLTLGKGKFSIEPGITWYIDNLFGQYLDMSVPLSIALIDKKTSFSISPAFNLGAYFGPDISDDGFNALMMRIDFPLAVKALELSPFVYYQIALKDSYTSAFSGGLSIALSY
ncbi:MAG: hypothetical protein A2096_00475 [Spirochaetes bacterium GWF1_41_5]|nr:MAG: hypothetical protein A2096_00475 [Spirochaetes bacterium GWF1_41_5]